MCKISTLNRETICLGINIVDCLAITRKIVTAINTIEIYQQKEGSKSLKYKTMCPPIKMLTQKDINLGQFKYEEVECLP